MTGGILPVKGQFPRLTGETDHPAPARPRLARVLSPAPADAPAVAVTDLVMRYGATTAVAGLSLTVERGSITAVLGPNGAGKTTTLETCEGFRRPQQGVVRVLGLDPVRQRRELMPRIGVMLQSGGAWPGARAEELLGHAAALHARPLPVGLLLERLSLGDCARTPYRRLSGGQQQRVALAMAVIGRPELLFVDEPTAGLDPVARRTTWALLEEMRADGVTVVLTTHHMEEAERLADVVHIVDHGRLVASSTPSGLTAEGRYSLEEVFLGLVAPDAVDHRPPPPAAPARHPRGTPGPIPGRIPGPTPGPIPGPTPEVTA